jgi:dCMP deaminase
MGEKRVSWDQYFMNIAEQATTRATCDRKHVGCVLVVDKQVVSTGYNGSVAGLKHCDEVGHLMEDGHCVRVIHAEMNAIAQAARRGAAIKGATAYITASPCWSCFKVLVNSGVRKIIFGEFYRDQRIFDAASELGVGLEKLEND